MENPAVAAMDSGRRTLNPAESAMDSGRRTLKPCGNSQGGLNPLLTRRQRQEVNAEPAMEAGETP